MRAANRVTTVGLVAVMWLVGACSAPPTPPHDKIAPANVTLIQHSLRADGFRQFFGDPGQGTRVGCADRVLGAGQHGLRVYLYIACGAWRPPRCGTTDGPNGTFPVVATVHDHSVTWQEPGDGADYAPTIHHLFPRSLWSEALNPHNVPILDAQAKTNAGCSAP